MCTCFTIQLFGGGGVDRLLKTTCERAKNWKQNKTLLAVHVHATGSGNFLPALFLDLRVFRRSWDELQQSTLVIVIGLVCGYQTILVLFARNSNGR